MRPLLYLVFIVRFVCLLKGSVGALSVLNNAEREYVVRAGETLHALSLRFGLDHDTLAK